METDAGTDGCSKLRWPLITQVALMCRPRALIMNVLPTQGDRRSIWHVSAAQDDVAALRSVIGSRSSDHSHFISNPSPLEIDSVSVGNGPEVTLRGSGIIEYPNDRDFFGFWAGTGLVTIRADGLGERVGNLDAGARALSLQRQRLASDPERTSNHSPRHRLLGRVALPRRRRI